MNLTGRLSWLLLLFNLLSISLFSQSARIDEVQFYFDGVSNTIIITYNFTDYSEFEIYEVELKFLDGSNQVISPVSLSGDIGKNVTGGTNKTIHWDIFNDVEGLSETARPSVTIKSVSTIPMDPSLALIMNQIDKSSKNKFVFKVKREGVMLLGAGSGISAIIFKLKADNFIDQQDVAVNIDEYNIAGENANKFYTLSKVSGCISVVCVGYSLYQYIWADKPGRGTQALTLNTTLNNGFSIAWVKNF